MKKIMVLVIAMFAIGCEQPGKGAQSASGDPVSAAPVTDEQFVAGLNGLWSSEPQEKWCSQSGDNWTCAAADIPAACDAPVWPIVGGYSVMGGGLLFQSGVIQYPDNPQAVTYADGALTLSPSGLVWKIDLLTPNSAVVSYGDGCSLLFER